MIQLRELLALCLVLGLAHLLSVQDGLYLNIGDIEGGGWE